MSKCEICGKKKVLFSMTMKNQSGLLWGRMACRSCALLVRDAVVALTNKLNPKPD